MPTIITWLRLIPPIPILQLGSRVTIEVAYYIGMSGSVNSSLGTPESQRPEEKPYREKSVNDASNELRKPFQCDLVAMPRIISNMNLAIPDIVSGPLGCDNALSWRQTKEGWKGEGTYGNTDLGGMTTPKRSREVRVAQSRRVSDCRSRQW